MIEDASVPPEDPSGRKRGEGAATWLEALVESSGDAIASETLEGIVVSWNPAATGLFGYEPDEIIGKSIARIIPPGLRAQEAEILSRLRGGAPGERFDTIGIAKDGRRVDIAITISPIRNESGGIIGVSRIARDITNLKRKAQTLREADRRKNEFLATLVHELRNPLAPIRTTAELLRRAENLAPELRALASILERQVRHMTRLVDDVLEVSRLSDGRIQLQREPLELAQLLQALIETYRREVQALQHEITFARPLDPIFVDGDRIRLTQVFSNVLHNAVKFTPTGGRIHVVLQREGEEALVSIHDSGIGIPQAMLEHIFELFARLQGAREHADRGLGIGLTLARRLVQLHQGRIEARSDGPTQGSEFLIWLPARATSPDSGARAGQGSPENAGSLKVLIADDNHDAAVSLSMLLQAMGHETRIAHDGCEAVDEADAFQPNIVLLDLGMPKLDGYGAARRIASRPWAGSTRIVALTGWGQNADRKRAKAAGFHQHLVKPVDAETRVPQSYAGG